MSTGTSLFLIAIFGGLGYLLYIIHRKKKWMLVLKIVGILIAVWILISGLVWAYLQYENRPQVTNTLGKVSLGMSPVDVTLALGKPSSESEDSDDELRYIYLDHYDDLKYFVRFDSRAVDLICTRDYVHKIFGLGVYSSEADVLDKLGVPSHTSINKDGLLKTISYDKYKVAYEIKEGEVESVCITQSGEVSYIEEYSNPR